MEIQAVIEANKKHLENKDLGVIERQLTEQTIAMLEKQLQMEQLLDF